MQREKEDTLHNCFTFNCYDINYSQAAGIRCLPVENRVNKQSSPRLLCWSHTAGLDFGPKFQGPQKGTMNNGMCSVEWGMYQDNVCVPGPKRLVPRAKTQHNYYQVREVGKQNKRVE